MVSFKTKCFAAQISLFLVKEIPAKVSENVNGNFGTIQMHVSVEPINKWHFSYCLHDMKHHVCTFSKNICAYVSYVHAYIHTYVYSKYMRYVNMYICMYLCSRNPCLRLCTCACTDEQFKATGQVFLEESDVKLLVYRDTCVSPRAHFVC